MTILLIPPPKNDTIEYSQKLINHFLAFNTLIPAKAFISAVRVLFDI